MLQEPRGTPGIVASIQTFGNQAANYHPHLHCLAADGLFASGGTFRFSSFISPVDISDLFRREVLEAFVEQELLPQEVAENMLSWPHSGFNVHIGPRLDPGDGDTLETTLRYTARAAISLQRLLYDKETGQVTYTYTSAYDHREHVERLPAHEFIARLTTHIPGRYERLIRYYGVYSSRSTRSSITSNPGRSTPGPYHSPTRRREEKPTQDHQKNRSGNAGCFLIQAVVYLVSRNSHSEAAYSTRNVRRQRSKSAITIHISPIIA